MSQQNDMELYRLAKKAKGLDSAEKRALVAIADAHSMRDGVCRKSVTTLCEEYGNTERSFRYGIRGRKRKNGTEYFPGLLTRGLVSITSGGSPKDGVPTVYKINREILLQFCEGTSAQTPAQTSAQENEDLCTNESEPLHNEGETSAQTPAPVQRSSLVLKPVQKDNSKPLVPAEAVSDFDENDFRASLKRELLEIAKKKNKPFTNIPARASEYITNLARKQDHNLVGIAVLDWFKGRSFVGLHNPGVAWSKLPEELGKYLEVEAVL